VLRRGWNTEVIARRTLGDDDRIELWFLAEHFLTTWSNWRGLVDRFHRYFGQSDKQMAPDRGGFAMARSVVFEQNERLVEHWQQLPGRVQG